MERNNHPIRLPSFRKDTFVIEVGGIPILLDSRYAVRRVVLSNTEGFTLIELSIVLIIIGLLVGGILVGKDLIRAAELRSVVSDIEKIRSAISTFRSKYQCLPGDCTIATSIWGTAFGGCILGARTGTQTCNGDGNGYINWGPYTTNENVLTEDGPMLNYEMFTAWQQLANAQLIPGNFTGLSGAASGRNAIISVNVPGSKIGGGGYYISSQLDVFDPVYSWPGTAGINYGTTITFGSQDPIHENYNAILAPLEAQNIDTKIDDGKPGTGNVMNSSPVTLPNCVTTNNINTSLYKSTTSNVSCNLQWSRIEF